MSEAPVLYLLCGLPCSGKSTWREKRLRVDPELIVISTDDELLKIARERGISYQAAFTGCYDEANRGELEKASKAFHGRFDLLWDQTNLSAKKRQTIMQMARGYYKIAVYFETPLETCLARNMARLSHNVPAHVIAGMEKVYVRPDAAEGFNDIISGNKNDAAHV